jgi:cytosine/adenosine deaminase-related metal-dependent hydrolase
MPPFPIPPLARSARLIALGGFVLASCKSAGSAGAETEISESSRIRSQPAQLPRGDTTPVALGTPSSGDTLEYSVLMAGRAAGRLRQWPDTSGTIGTSFTYGDRGLGPSLTQTLRVDKAGIPVGMQLVGTSYLRGAVRESITPGPGKLVTWRNDNAAGRVTPGTGYYLPLETLPSDVAALARALVLSKTKTLPLLPDGVVRLTAGTPRTVSGGGLTLRITPCEISGLGLTPVLVWLDADQRLFSSQTDDYRVIRRGFEAVIPTLVEAEQAASAGRHGALARRLARQPRGPVAFVHASLFDAESKSMRRLQTLVVQGDRVIAAGADGSVAIPADAEVIDGTGKSLLPGLWDMHAHVTDDDGLLHLAAGVTTVRDLAGDSDALLARRSRFDDGTLLGPRVIMAGVIDGPGPLAGPTRVQVETRDAARTAVEAYADRGYAQVAVAPSLDPQLVQTITRTAHQRGLRVSGQVPFGMTAEQMVRAGADELQHVNALFLNFLTDSAIDTRTAARVTDVARRAGAVDVRSESVVRFIQLLKERSVVVDPTLNRFEGLLTFRPGVLNDATLPVAQRMPVVARRALLTGGLPSTPVLETAYKASFINMERLVRRLHEAGVTIVAGTDGSAGFSLHRELELYSEASLPNLDILHLATLGAAKVMRQDAERGSLAVGRVADLVLVDGDPSQRMRDLRRMELVMKGGVIYLPDSLYAAVGVKPAPRKGAIPSRELRAQDVICRGAAAVTKRGEAAPLDCTVIDSSGARNRRPAPARRARPKKP